ncbi:pitrilysin family protein [Stakelama sediminis]|uniref:Zinc protease n=1 Tax=Stakelama sediminis TaxID=463200 RepID=A0A840Z2X7_9SPHN|nr:pitrilysin family protein [Stakelama sediminis]MBB5720275.1 zinc protease [Stakelama sediminis]
MRMSRAALFVGAALLPFTASAQTAPAPAAATSGDGVKPLNFTHRTLANGLQVYAIRDTNTATVSVQVWYKVGSKDDPKGRSGFAHMFEHLMFKATRNLPAESMDRLTGDVGGYNNASTNQDYTNYYEVIPANHLQQLLFAEADRMSSLVVDPAVFKSEREVVKEELRTRVLAQPYGKLFYLYFPEISFQTSPYGRPGIGSIADLDAATIDDIRAFHATYYRPDNAVLVVAGNFDPAELNKWVDEYFAPIKRPDRPIPTVSTTEPERTKATHYTVYEKNVPLPAVLISYPIPADDSADTPALSVLNAVLSAGESSRLYENLVYRDQLAQAADTFMDSKKGTGALGVYAIMAPGKSAKAGEAALRAQIASLRDKPVSAAELNEAKNQILTGSIQGRETADGKASTLASSVVIDGNPHAADEQLAAIAKVTAADVQRVAQKYLGENRSAALLYLPESAKPADATGDTVAVSKTIAVKPLVTPPNVPVVELAPPNQRKPLPPVGPPVKVAMPTPVVTKLDNGMQLVVVHRSELPLVTAVLETRGGGALDPSGKAGLESLTADLMTKGTKTRSATQIAQAVESLGGSISSGASWDGQGVTITVKGDQITPALDILADVARNPAFAQAEIDRARTKELGNLKVSLSNPGALSGIVANRAVFGTKPYGHLLSGTPKSLTSLTRDDVMGAYQSVWKPETTSLVLVGDINENDARALADKLFGDWQASPDAATPTAPDANAAYPAPRVIVVDMPGAGQAGVVVGRPGLKRSAPDYYPAIVANSVLGVGYSSRLNTEIRIKRGLSYGAGSSLDGRLETGPFMAKVQTKNPSATEVVGLIRTEMEKLGTDPVGTKELDARKATLIGSYGRSTETNSGIAGILSSYIVEGVPLDEIKRFIPSVQAVDAAQVQKAAEKLLNPDEASIIVVGDSKQFLDSLRKEYPKVEVIPAASLDLDSPTLK